MTAACLTPRRAFALIALVLLAYGPAWPGGFLVEDWTFLERHEEWSLAQTVRFELGFPLRDRAWVERERPDFFTAALWRPLPYILYHLEARAFGTWPGGYFLGRLTCHALTACLFAAAVTAWTRRRAWGWVAGVFMGLHPSRLYPLLVVCQSQILLAGLGVTLALWGLGVWRNGRPKAGWFAGLAGTVVAAWSYEQAVLVLLALPVLDALTPQANGAHPGRAAVVRRSVPLGGVLALYGALRVVRFGGLGGYTSLDQGQAILDLDHPFLLLTQIIRASAYGMLSLAAPISVQDWRLTTPPGGPIERVPMLLNAIIVVATAAIIVVRAQGSPRRAVRGALGYVLFLAWTLLPVAPLLSGHDAWNRYLYFPGFAWVVVLAWAATPPAKPRTALLATGVATALFLGIAWWGVYVWKAAWRQAHGLRTAIAETVPRDRMAYVYLRDFSEWVGGRNLFIRNLSGPIDVGLDAERLRVWPASWPGPQSVPVSPASTWPFAQAPFVRLGMWQRTAATLELKRPPAYHPGRAQDILLWDMHLREDRAAWRLGSLLAEEPGRADGLRFTVLSEFAALDSPRLNDLTWTPAVLGVTMHVQAPTTERDWLEILFYTPAQTRASPTHVLRVRTHSDGRPHQYMIALLDHPAPALEGPLERLSLRLSRYPGTRIQLDTVWLAAAAAGPPDAGPGRGQEHSRGAK